MPGNAPTETRRDTELASIGEAGTAAHHMTCLCVQCDEAAGWPRTEGVLRLTTITMMMTMTIMTRAVIMAAFVSLMLVF